MLRNAFMACCVIYKKSKTVATCAMNGNTMPDEANTPEKNASTTRTKKIILVAEDDEGIGTMLAHFISDETPYEVLLVTNARRALQVVQEVKPALLLLDYHLPSMT